MRGAYTTRLAQAGVVCPSSMMRRLYFELLLKRLQIVSVHVRNCPIIEVRVSPVQKLIAPRASQLWRQVRKDDRSENDGGCETETGETEPIPWRSEKNGSRLWLPSWEQRLSISRNISHGPFGDLFSQRRLNSLT